MIKIKRPLVLKWVAVFVTVVAALDEFCRIDSDCPEGRCYLEGYEENATGFCMCDEATNSGCNASKGQTCERTNFGGSFQGGPSGLHTSCIVPMDAECSDDKECEGICFVPNNNHIMTGTCKCQADWNVGCPHILEIECTDADVASGGVPRCAKRLGKACLEDFECGSRNCFEGICRCVVRNSPELFSFSSLPQQCVLLDVTSRKMQNSGTVDAQMGPMFTRVAIFLNSTYQQVST